MSENLWNSVLAHLGAAHISSSEWGDVVGNKPLTSPPLSLFWDREEQMKLMQTEASPSHQKPRQLF